MPDIFSRIRRAVQARELGTGPIPAPPSYDEQEAVLPRSAVDPGIVIGDGTPIPGWAQRKIDELTYQLQAKDRLIARLEQQLAAAAQAQRPVVLTDQTSASVMRRAAIRTLGGPVMRLAACDADRHLVDAVVADREQVEQANDRLRAENEQLRQKAGA